MYVCLISNLAPILKMKSLFSYPLTLINLVSVIIELHKKQIIINFHIFKNQNYLYKRLTKIEHTQTCTNHHRMHDRNGKQCSYRRLFLCGKKDLFTINDFIQHWGFLCIIFFTSKMEVWMTNTRKINQLQCKSFCHTL